MNEQTLEIEYSTSREPTDIRHSFFFFRKGPLPPPTLNTLLPRHYAVNLVVHHRGTDKAKSVHDFSSLRVVPQMLEANKKK